MAFNLGDGTNAVTGTGTHLVRVGNAFNYAGGIGNDTFDLDGSGAALDVRGDAKFTLGHRARVRRQRGQLRVAGRPERDSSSAGPGRTRSRCPGPWPSPGP